jgi:hypothetical protein
MLDSPAAMPGLLAVLPSEAFRFSISSLLSAAYQGCPIPAQLQDKSH